MSVDHLAQLLQARAFRPRHDLDDLPGDHVPFEQLTQGHADPEAALRDALTSQEAGCVAVIGPSGAGKSSTIATVLDALPDEAYLPLVVRASGATTQLQDPGEFARFVLQEVVARAEKSIDSHAKTGLRRAAADRTTTTSGGAKVGGTIGLPFTDSKLAVEVKNTATAEEALANPTRSIDGLQRAMILIQSGRRSPRTPVLVLDDTDKWAGGPTGAVDAEAADGFFDHGVRVLASQITVPMVVAVHERFLALDGYRSVEKLLAAEVAIPEFPSPVRALEDVLRRRIEFSDVEAEVLEIFEHEALFVLEGAYEESDRDLRYTLGVADQALEQLRRDLPDRLTHDHLLSAARSVRQQRRRG